VAHLNEPPTSEGGELFNCILTPQDDNLITNSFLGLKIHLLVILGGYTGFKDSNKGDNGMKNTKFLLSFLVLPALVLAACSAKPAASTTSQASQNSGVTAANPTTPIKTVAQVVVPPAQTNVTTSGDLLALQNAFESIYQKVAPSVVRIDVVEAAAPSTGSNNSRNNPFANPAPSAAIGTGFIWDTKGDIVTNNHVVSGASTITVTFFDGSSYTATVVGTEINADLAVINVKAPATEFVPVTLADSSQLQVGEIAIAIGTPYGETSTMTQGIVSAVSRALPVLDPTSGNAATTTSGLAYTIPDVIQTDAPINPGNSGGVLVNLDGQVIGVPYEMESGAQTSSGIGFAIPSEIVNSVVPALVKNGSFNTPWLGISGGDLTPDLAAAMNLPATQKGALIVTVTAGGPAATAGLQPSTQQVTIAGQSVTVGGDVVTAINGVAINNFDDLAVYIFAHTNSGDTVNFTVLRQGKQVQVPVTIGTRPTQ
jgi:serine protease Do